MRRVHGAAAAVMLMAAGLTPAAALAQSLGCIAVNDGEINFTAKVVAQDPRQPETTARTVTSTAALSVIAAAGGYTDTISSNLVSGTRPFTVGDRLDFTAVVSQYSGTAGMRIRFRVNNSYLSLPAGARVSPDPTSTGTYTGYYNVPSGLQGIGMTLDHLGGTSNSLTSITVTCTPFTDSSLSLGVSMSHVGTPAQGGTVDYTITPSASGAATGSNLTLTFSLPSGLSYDSGSGSGWACTSTRCVYSNTIANGASGNPLTLRLNVAANAAASLTPSVTLSGGNAGSSANASDPTTISVVQTPASVTVAGGNSQSASVNAAFTTPLSVTVRDGSNAVIANTSVTFAAPGSGASGTFSNSSNSITVTTDGSGVASAGTFTANATTGSYSVTATAGSASTSFSLTNNAAATPPTVTGISPTSGTTAGGTSVVITGTNFTGATAVSFGATAASGFTVNSATQITATSPAGAAGVVDVTVTTPSGTSGTGAADQFTYVAAPATPTITASPPSLSNSSSASFQFSLASGTAECSIDSGAFSACTSPQAYTGLSDGSHTFQVRAVSSGVYSAAASHSWTVDTTAPAAPTVSSPANSSSRVVSQKGVTGSAEANSTVTVYLDGSADGTTTADGAGAWSYTLNTLTAASHTVRARATDAAGNTSSDSATNTFTAVAVLTATQAVSSISGTINTLLTTVQPVTTSGGQPTITYALSGGTLPTGLLFSTATGQLSGTPTTALSSTTFTVTATDALSQTAAQTFSLAVANASQTISFLSSAPSSAVVGGATYTPSASATSGLTVTFSIDSSSSAVCSISGGVVSFTGTGTCLVNANQAGNGSYSAAPQAQQSFTVGAGTQTISFTSSAPGGAKVGGATYTPAATATSGLSATFSIDSGSSAVCTISGGVISFTGVGTCLVNANQAGNGSYGAASQVQQSFSVAKGDQTITFGALSNVAISASPLTLSATSTAALAVAFSSTTTSICTVSGVTLTLVAQGTCSVDANQTGNATWNAAPTVSRSFTVMPATLALSTGATGTTRVGVAFSQANTPTGGVSPYQFTVSAGALPAGVSLDAATGTISGTPTTAGAFSYALSLTDSNSPVGSVSGTTVSGTIAKGSQTLTFTSTAPTSASVGGATYTVAATSSASLTPTYSIAGSSSGICTISGATVSFVAIGSCVVTADQAGNANYDPATAVSQTISVAGAPVVAARSGVSVPYNSSGLAIDLSASITGPAHTSIAVATAPAHGTTTVAGDVVTYVPTSGYFGADSFTYTATGPGGTSSPATVTLTVETPAAPTVTNLSVAVAYNASGQAIGLQASGVVTSLSIGTGPANGVVSLDGSTATYTPNQGYFGSDSFTYLATGPGGASEAATVTLTVTAPSAPVAGNVSAEVFSNGAGQTIGLAISGVFTSVNVVSSPSNGSVTISGASATYTPNSGYTGSDSFSYVAVGPGGTSATAGVSITVSAPPPPPTPQPTNVNTAGATVEGGSSVDVNLSTLVVGVFNTLEIATPPSNGTVRLIGPGGAEASSAASSSARSSGANRAPLADSGGGWTAVYSPKPGFIGRDTFQFVAIGPGGRSAPATVTILVGGSVPIAQSKTATADDGQTISVDLLAGATGGPITSAEIVSINPTGAATGKIVQGGTADEPTFRLDVTPRSHFSGVLMVGYRLVNAFGESAPATVTITVTARPDPSLDPAVRALSDTQVEAARRFARSQTANFMDRAQQLHGGGGADGMGVRLSLRDVFDPHHDRLFAARDDQFGLTDWRRGPSTNAVSLRDDEGREPTAQRLSSRGAETPPGHNALGPASSDALAEDDGDQGGPRAVGEVALWTGGAIEIGTMDRRKGRAKITLSSSGLSTGADVKLAEWATVGVGGGYGEDISRIDSGAARVRSETWVAAAYGSFQPLQGAFIDTVIGRGTLDYRTRRAVEANGMTALGHRKGDMTFGALSFGVDRLDGGIHWSSYGRFEWLKGDLDAYAETGAERYNLRFDGRDVSSLTGALGAKLEFTRDLPFGVVTPRLGAEWLHEFRGVGAQALDYADFEGASTYRISTVDWRREQYRLSLGGRLVTPSRWMVDMEVGYRGAAGQGVGQLRLRVVKPL
ncbi:autotransporter domain-containing protein [Caulobacter sp. BP25]|uniref:autotransporter domain-containing protein n=1 Tax=Caulobacter sp. BP25 TaxID=2048900 RepID=UPI001374809F|nr:autotransporter domain-containing protein [Caulobacter sp. BP25]